MKTHSFWLFLLFALIGACSDSSRDGYDIPVVGSNEDEKEMEASIKVLSENIKSNPSNPDNYYKRAVWKLKAGNYKEALIDITRGESRNPNSPKILFVKSLILEKLGDKNALENALFAESHGAKFPDAYLLIAKLYLRDKNYAKAREYFGKAENKYPYHADLFNGKGLYYAMQRDTVTAILNYKKAVALKPSKFEYYDDLIKIYGKARMADSALTLNDKAIKKFPSMTELVYNKAMILENVGAADSSIRIYRNFLKLEPERYDVYDRIGGIYFKNRNYTSAFANYNKWAGFVPNNPVPKLKAARCYLAQNNLPAAKYYLQKAIDKHPSDKSLANELAGVEYRITYYQRGNDSYAKRPNNNAYTEQEPEKKLFERAGIELSPLPKRRPIIGRDTTRN